jgi:hypothetical protein
MNAKAETPAKPVAVHKSLYSALAAAQADMGPALKDSVNPAFKSKYADLASVMAACLPALNANGIAVLQPPYQNETGERFVKTIFVHGETGESVECAVPLIVSKNDMQGYGSAVTYARRYGLMSMAGIAPEDDDGNAAAKAAPEAAKAAPERHSVLQPGPGAIEIARSSLSKAQSLDALAAIWGDLPPAVKKEAVVAQAKEARKAALSPPIAEDEIPY